MCMKETRQEKSDPVSEKGGEWTFTQKQTMTKVNLPVGHVHTYTTGQTGQVLDEIIFYGA